MIINKNLECVLTIQDTNILFSKSINNKILNRLKQKYNNKCYLSCFIIDVKKIVRRSFINCNENLDSDFNINIQFEAEVLIYQKNDIIHDCKIIKKESNGIIHGKSKYCGIQLNIQQNLSIYDSGDTIPVIVKMLRYNINQSEISVLATPFIPLKYDIIIYNTINNLTDIGYKKLLELNNSVKNLDDKINKLNKSNMNVFNFFKGLLSNYNLKDKNNLDKKIKTTIIDNSLINKLSNYKKFKIDDLLNDINSKKTKNYILFRPYNSYDTNYCNVITNYSIDEKIFNSNINNKSNNINILNDPNVLIVNENIKNILEIYIYENIRNKQCLLDFISYYPSLQDVQKLKDVWKLYNKFKK